MRYLSVILLCVFIVSCNTSKEHSISADELVNTSIEASGGELIDNATLEFDFRDKHYSAERSQGHFRLVREFKDSTSHTVSIIRDVLNNNGFQRFVDELLVEIPDSMAIKYAASVNSVHYFSVLPYGLNDKAVNKTRLEDVLIKGQDYHTIKVTFDQEGGGEDYEDVFLYWINVNTTIVDYLAYSYNEDHGQGMRFREAYNERYVDGIRFVDYNNYKPESNSVNLDDLPKLFEKDALKLLSKIELKHINVTLN